MFSLSLVKYMSVTKDVCDNYLREALYFSSQFELFQTPVLIKPFALNTMHRTASGGLNVECFLLLTNKVSESPEVLVPGGEISKLDRVDATSIFFESLVFSIFSRRNELFVVRLLEQFMRCFLAIGSKWLSSTTSLAAPKLFGADEVRTVLWSNIILQLVFMTPCRARRL